MSALHCLFVDFYSFLIDLIVLLMFTDILFEQWPSFWYRNGPQGLHQFNLRLIYDIVPMSWNIPVTVNYHEAVAFSNWKSQKDNKKYRLMTELEYNAILDIKDDIKPTENALDPILSLNIGPNSNQIGNMNLIYGSCTPVNHFKPNKLGFYDVLGNVWEWTTDYFSPLNNFKIHAYYEDFSTPCFDGRHHIIKGGSFISTGNESSIYSRFHFRPHFLQHASFRLIESSSDNVIHSDMDSKGPYVGNYPFRKSNDLVNEIPLNSVIENVNSIQNSNSNSNEVKMVFARINTQKEAKLIAENLLLNKIATHVSLLTNNNTYSLDVNNKLQENNDYMLLIQANPMNIEKISQIVSIVKLI